MDVSLTVEPLVLMSAKEAAPIWSIFEAGNNKSCFRPSGEEEHESINVGMNRATNKRVFTIGILT